MFIAVRRPGEVLHRTGAGLCTLAQRGSDRLLDRKKVEAKLANIIMVGSI